LPGPLSGVQEDASHTNWGRHGSIIDSMAKSNGAATVMLPQLWLVEPLGRQKESTLCRRRHSARGMRGGGIGAVRIRV